ncbi:MAG: hypothetical protein PHN52_05345 [candidate division Zixibacteria bacterium]|nr:hypothetical protein [candidate division Zixibacteria bacterium]
MKFILTGRKVILITICQILIIDPVLLFSEPADNPVADYYWDRARSVRKSRDPVETGTSYSFVATSFYKKVDRRGQVVDVDTLSSEYFFSWGNLDSSRTLFGDPDRFRTLDLNVPDIFKFDYYHYFFSNDTGGADLAIGFDTRVASDPGPVGLIIIDRNRFLLRWMYLFYPFKEKYKRFSRSFRFVEIEGYLFPDSIWEVGSKRGIFFSDDYRLETGIDNFKIYRNR